MIQNKHYFHFRRRDIQVYKYKKKTPNIENEIAMLSRQEALQFIHDVIEVPEPERRMAASKLNFLNLLILNMQHTFPFQSVSLIAEEPGKRHRPSWTEIKEAMFQKIGGVCYTQNVFLYALLQSLGYEVSLNPCTVTSSVTYPNNHVIILVRNVVTHGDVYLTDVAIGHPAFHAISLDFELESPVYNNSYLEYKYIKKDGKIMRMHGDGDFRPPKELPFDFYVGNFRRFYEMELKPLSQISDFDRYFDDVYTKKEASPFHLSLRSCIFKKERAVIIVNSRLLTENDDRKFDVTHLNDDNEIAEAYKTHFPMLPFHLVQAAINNRREINTTSS